MWSQAMARALSPRVLLPVARPCEGILGNAVPKPSCLLVKNAPCKNARFVSATSSTNAVSSGSQAAEQKVHVSNLQSILDRGTYNENMYKHVKGSGIQKVDIQADGKYIIVHWEDGTQSKYHSMWLRYYSFCDKSRMDHTGQLKIEFDKITEESRVTSVKDDGEGCLTVKWKEDPSLTGIFPLQFLKEHCYSRQSLDNKRLQTRMSFSENPIIPKVPYNEVMGSGEGLYEWVKALNEVGIAVVKNVPCEEGMVKKVCQRIADIPQHTIYGETFDVVAVPRPINAAYDSGELKLHMDQPMYESPPGIQALHCIKFDENIQGGDNLFVDLFHVAETFRVKHPEEFDLLSKVPVPYETIHYSRDWPVHMRYERPMFGLNAHKELTGVVWHPHLLGTLQLEDNLVEPFLKACGLFYGLINNFPYYFRHRLQAGDLIAFNNRRVLHGRASYSQQTGTRFLQGTYIEISEFKSCVKVLSNLVGNGKRPTRVGDFDLQ